MISSPTYSTNRTYLISFVALFFILFEDRYAMTIQLCMDVCFFFIKHTYMCVYVCMYVFIFYKYFRFLSCLFFIIIISIFFFLFIHVYNLFFYDFV